MAGVTDAPFRTLCQRFQAGLTTSEMVTVKTEHWHTDKSRLRFAATDNDRIPHSVQIVGSDPAAMAAAAVQVEAGGADIIDINMGCPAKKVCKKAAGSALLKDEDLVTQILQYVVNAVSVPVTLKIRTGWDAQNRNAVTIARIAQDSGIQLLTVHGRTRACRFVGAVEYDTIADVKHAVEIPVIANGDITSVAVAQKVADYTGVDGIMIGRGALGQPWLIEAIAAGMQGKSITALSLAQKCQEIESHIRALHQFYGEYKGVCFSRKHMAWYLEHLELDCHYKQQFNRFQTVQEQLHFVQQLPLMLTKGKAA
ncbi:putative tRNA-dihydrouridine synthase [BD1-7 clade bacterium]|uniref:tRNA-dihydrouridine synthase n=1 Tax=BD1-7 clade bacterium TaxID=2029982 RepID=A0A5S9Q8R6_9GAMM|nr:putative tRNA-dihydrouridine synthase [BD1-7 clade bacterium]